MMDSEIVESFHKNLTHVKFRDNKFIDMFGLDETTVMDYFYLSPFYEKASINQTCLIQRIDFNSNKTKYQGIEFNLEYVSKEKDLFHIGKYYRNYKESSLISYYYVFKGDIFQSPDVYSVLTSNIQSISHSLSSVLKELDEIK